MLVFIAAEGRVLLALVLLVLIKALLQVVCPRPGVFETLGGAKSTPPSRTGVLIAD